MSAKILKFRGPMDYPKDYPSEYKAKIPSLAAMVTTLKIDYWSELTYGQQDIVLVAEQRAMRGEDNPAYYKSVHQILVKVGTQSRLEKIKEFCKRFTHKQR